MNELQKEFQAFRKLYSGTKERVGETILDNDTTLETQAISYSYQGDLSGYETMLDFLEHNPSPDANPKTGPEGRST